MSRDPVFVTDPSVRAAYSEDASGLIGLPDAVVRPADEKEVTEAVAWCAARGTGVTAQGLRSSTVGSPLAFGGVALSLEKMDRIVSIDPDRLAAVVEPGVNLGAFKRELKKAGLFFPPDPTSENECTVGGAVMTNASGARTFKYGATRPWIRRLRLVLGDGRLTEVRRSETTKNTVGYFGFQNPVDLLIGSEGTLGITTQIEVTLLPAPPGTVAGMAFFPTLEAALRFVKEAARSPRQPGGLSPRCLELFDDGALDLVRPQSGGLLIPREARAAIFLEQETAPDAQEAVLETWDAAIGASGGLPDDTIVASTEAQEEDLRRLRHAIPATMNEKGRAARRSGGLKIGTDWAVPLDRVEVMIEEATRIARDEFGGFFIRYGHIGNGHPHFNLLAETPEMLERARRSAHLMCLKAVELGGTVTAEHGIGKLKRDYVSLQYPAWVIEAMRAVKRTLDPRGILAPGNIFEEPPPSVSW